MSPLPGHDVIPAAWSAHHRPTAVATMNATCDLTTPADGPAPYPLPDGWTGTTVLAAGIRCRVQRLVTENTGVQAEQVQATRRYLVTLPLDEVPDLQVTDHGPHLLVHGGDDPHLDGLRLKVVDVQHGSYAWQRDLIAVHNLTQD